VRQLVSIYIIFFKNIIHLFLTQFYVINQLIGTIRTLVEVTGSLEVHVKFQGLESHLLLHSILRTCPFIGLMMSKFSSIEEELRFFRYLMDSVNDINCPSECSCKDPTVLAGSSSRGKEDPADDHHGDGVNTTKQDRSSSSNR